jgi:AcrR family transcriptional regulator
MSLREEQTRATRQRVLAAAGRLFTEQGYVGTRLADVAREAGVSLQTVYNLVGGKAVLLKAVYDVTVAGDDEPVPMAERPLLRAVITATTGRECLARYAVAGRVLGERTLPLVTRLLAQAATGDPDLREFAATIEGERGVATSRLARHLADRFGLKPGVDVRAAADLLWTLTSPDISDRLVNRRSWGWDRYQEWLGEAMADAVLG